MHETPLSPRLTWASSWAITPFELDGVRPAQEAAA